MRPILPIPGVPDELIRVLNDRLREAEASNRPSDPGAATLPNVGTPGRFTAGTTDAKGRVVERSRLQESDLPGGGYPLDNEAQIAYGTNPSQVLGGIYADLTGATIALNRSGRYLIRAIFSFLSVGVGITAFQGRIDMDGSASPTYATLNTNDNAFNYQCSLECMYTAAAPGKVVKLQVANTGGVGQARGTLSSISALWLGA